MKKIQVVKYCVLSIVLTFVLLLSGCRSVQFPQDGIWRCDEINITISVERTALSTVILDGQEWQCMVEQAGIDSDYFYLYCIDDGKYRYQTLFAGEAIELDNDYFIVEERNTGKEYRFVRIDK